MCSISQLEDFSSDATYFYFQLFPDLQITDKAALTLEHTIHQRFAPGSNRVFQGLQSPRGRVGPCLPPVRQEWLIALNSWYSSWFTLHKMLDGNLIESARSVSCKYWNQGTFHALETILLWLQIGKQSHYWRWSTTAWLESDCDSLPADLALREWGFLDNVGLWQNSHQRGREESHLTKDIKYALAVTPKVLLFLQWKCSVWTLRICGGYSSGDWHFQTGSFEVLRERSSGYWFPWKASTQKVGGHRRRRWFQKSCGMLLGPASSPSSLQYGFPTHFRPKCQLAWAIPTWL